MRDQPRHTICPDPGCSSTSARSVLSGYHYRPGPCQAVKVTASRSLRRVGLRRPWRAVAEGISRGRNSARRRAATPAKPAVQRTASPPGQHQPAPRDSTPHPPSQQALPRRLEHARLRLPRRGKFMSTSACRGRASAQQTPSPSRRSGRSVSRLCKAPCCCSQDGPHLSAPERTLCGSHRRGCSHRLWRAEEVQRPWSKFGEFRWRLRRAVWA